MDTLIGCELVSKSPSKKAKRGGDVPAYWVQMLINWGTGVCVDKRNESNICLGERSLVPNCGERVWEIYERGGIVASHLKL